MTLSYRFISLIPQTPHQRERRVWYTLSAFWGTKDLARLVIVMTMHRFGMATHQPLSRTAIVAYSRCRMIITCKPNSVNLIGTSEFRSKPKKTLDVYQTPLPLLGRVYGQDYYRFIESSTHHIAMLF